MTIMTHSLFDAPLVRNSDPDTSHAAAKAITPALSELQQRVYAALKSHGPMSDGEIIALPQFAGMAESTARKRRTDLVRMGMVVRVGTKINGRGREVATWGIK